MFISKIFHQRVAQRLRPAKTFIAGIWIFPEGVILAVNEGYSLVDESVLDDQSVGYAVEDVSEWRRSQNTDELS